MLFCSFLLPPLPPCLLNVLGFLCGKTVYKGNSRGHTNLPDRFYEGIHVGISNYDVAAFIEKHVGSGGGGSPRVAERSPSSDFAYYDELVEAIRLETSGGGSGKLHPPDAVFPWVVYFGNVTDSGGAGAVLKKGVVLYYSFALMKDAGIMKENMSVDGTMTIRDYSAALDMVEALARRLECMTVHRWFPNQFGLGTGNSDDKSNRNIIQLVKPIRTGLQDLTSSSAVWRRDNLN